MFWKSFLSNVKQWCYLEAMTINNPTISGPKWSAFSLKNSRSSYILFSSIPQLYLFLFISPVMSWDSACLSSHMNNNPFLALEGKFHTVLKIVTVGIIPFYVDDFILTYAEGLWIWNNVVFICYLDINNCQILTLWKYNLFVTFIPTVGMIK